MGFFAYLKDFHKRYKKARELEDHVAKIRRIVKREMLHNDMIDVLIEIEEFFFEMAKDCKKYYNLFLEKIKEIFFIIDPHYHY